MNRHRMAITARVRELQDLLAAQYSEVAGQPVELGDILEACLSNVVSEAVCDQIRFNRLGLLPGEES